MSLYYIVNLVETKRQQKLMYWVANAADTPDVNKALIVNEDQVNRNLDRYDNGSTTQAVLCEAAHDHRGPWQALVHGKRPPQPEGAVA